MVSAPPTFIELSIFNNLFIFLYATRLAIALAIEGVPVYFFIV